MDEFLEKLREDQRRMRKFLQAQGMRFRRMGEALAVARERSARIFVAAEDPLSGLSRVIAEEYLAQLPALPLDLMQDPPPAGASDSDSASDLEKLTDGQGPPPRAARLARHFRSGDVLIMFAHRGDDATTRALLGFAKMRGVYAILVGGMDAKSTLQRAADAALILPTRGVKTVCEGSFVCARILARCARASLKARAADEEAKLIRVECTSCKEPVFVEERYRGKKGQCPLCRASIRIPEGGAAVEVAPDDEDEAPKKRSSRRAPAQAEREKTSERITPKPERAETPPAGTSSKKPLKPSVMDFEAPDLAELELEDASHPPSEVPPAPPLAALEEPKREGSSSRRRREAAAEPAEEEEERPPVGLDSRAPHAEREEPSGIQLASADVAFDPATGATQSADAYALENGHAPDTATPAPRSASDTGAAAESTADATQSQRLVSARFTVSECRLRFGVGGFPDGDSPEHSLEELMPQRLAFRLNPEDEAGGTLDKGDQLWLRLEVPAFLEPVLVRGVVARIGGSSGSGARGSRVEIDLRDVDAATARKLVRAAESLVAT